MRMCEIENKIGSGLTKQAARAFVGVVAAAALALAGAPAAQAESSAPPTLLNGATGAIAVQPRPASLFQPVLARPHSAVGFSAPSAGEPAPAVAGVFGAALEKAFRRRDRALKAAYAAHGFQPIWLQVDAGGVLRGATKARALVAAFGMADAHALPAARYKAAELSARLDAAPADAAGLATLERDLARAFVAFGSDIHGGALRPSALSRDIDVKQPEVETAALLAMARMRPDPAAIFNELAPQSADYARLKRLWARLRDIARAGAAPSPIKGEPVRLGDAGPTVAAVRARLAAMGDLAAGAPASRDATSGAVVP